MSMTEQISQVVKAHVQKTGVTIEALAAIGDELGEPSSPKRLRQARQGLEAETLRVMVLGRFKTGKSTLLNALLGRRTHPVPELPSDTVPLPVNDLPCTARLTSIHYAEKARIRVWKGENRSEEWSLKKYLEESSVKVEAEATRRFFQDILAFELFFPAELCKAGVT